jgi:hypothetical protein
MANAAQHGGHVSGLGATTRQDKWWLAPLLVVAGLGGWGLYYMWAAWQAEFYTAGPYLSPFYSPLLLTPPADQLSEVAGVSEAVQHHTWLKSIAWPSWWPSWIPASPAFLIFVFPATFRATCYYYRKAYYRAFFGMPPGCGVGGVSHNYRGETGLLVIQNLHRYTLYFALVLLPFLYIDAFGAFFYEGSFGVGVGSLFMLTNAVLLTCYTLGCHAWRHLIGGRLNCFSCDGLSEAQHGAWTFTSFLNARHMKFAWLSLGWILVTDIYIRLLSMGIIHDLNTWGGLVKFNGGY